MVDKMLKVLSEHLMRFKIRNLVGNSYENLHGVFKQTVETISRLPSCFQSGKNHLFPFFVLDVWTDR